VPPNVSAMSFNWISGGAMVQLWLGAGASARRRWMRRMV
jgi:hypothetical protein